MNNHYIQRSNWLRAAVLGANDGIISISSLAVGVVNAQESHDSVILATIAGLVAGAISMAAGEYVSVSSQKDTENADIEREKLELEQMPDEELNILAHIYEKRGLKKATAMQVAVELTQKDALAAHIRDELGINEVNVVNPLSAAIASGLAFTFGAILPLGVVVFGPTEKMTLWIYGFSIVFLILLGILSAVTGGSKIWKAVLRITIWGTIAIALSGYIGHLFGIQI